MHCGILLATLGRWCDFFVFYFLFFFVLFFFGFFLFFNKKNKKYIEILLKKTHKQFENMKKSNGSPGPPYQCLQPGVVASST